MLYNPATQTWVGNANVIPSASSNCTDYFQGPERVATSSSAERFMVLDENGAMSTGGPTYGNSITLLNVSRAGASATAKDPNWPNCDIQSVNVNDCPFLWNAHTASTEEACMYAFLNSFSDAKYDPNIQLNFKPFNNWTAATSPIQAAPLSNFGNILCGTAQVSITSNLETSNCLEAYTAQKGADGYLAVQENTGCPTSVVNNQVFQVYFALGFGTKSCPGPNGPTNGPQPAIGLIPAATCSQQTDTAMLIGIIVGSLVLAIIAAVAVSFWNKRKKIKTAV